MGVHTLLLVAMVWMPVSASARQDGGGESNFLGQSLEKLVENYQNNKRSLVNLDKNQRKILGNLYLLTKKMKTMAEKQSQLSDRVISAKGNVQSLAKTISKLEWRIKNQRRDLAQRLKTLYMSGNQTMLQAIFSSSSAAELDRSFKFMKLVSDRDYQMIKSHEKNLFELEQRRIVLKSKVRKLLKARTKLKKHETILESTQRSKNKLLAALKLDRKNKIKKLEGIRRKSLSLQVSDKKIVRALEESFFERKGQLLAPVGVEVTNDFGLLVSEKYKYRLSHKGHFYATSLLEPIQSVFNGTVAFVGNISGYGHTIIVDHGDHYYSIYGQIHKPKVNVGDKIRSGQRIASSGFGTRGFGSGLYFEIRHFSEAIDPAKWLAPKIKQHHARAGEKI